MEREEITLDKAESLLKDISSKKMNGHEFKEKYNNTVEGMPNILNKQPLTTNEKNMVKIVLPLKDIIKPNDKENR